MKSTIDSRWLTAAVVLITATTGCGQPDQSPSGADRSAVAASDAGSRADETAVRVEVVEVESRDVVRSIDLPATVEGIMEADLYAKIAGYVAEVTVDIGDVVEKGQALVRLSVPELEAELAQRAAEVEGSRARLEQAQLRRSQAEADLAVARAEADQAAARVAEQEALVQLRKAEFERWQKLLEGAPAIEKRRLDEARYELAAAEAALAAAKAAAATAQARVTAAEAAVRSQEAAVAAAQKDLAVATAALRKTRALVEYATLRAPWPGRIVRRLVHPGDFALPAASNSSAKPLIRLASIDRVRVVAYVPVGDSRYLDIGDPVVLHDFKSAPDVSVRASVTRIAPAYERDTRLMRVEVHIDNQPAENGQFVFLPGTFGYMTVQLERYKDAPVVPSTALLSDAETGQSFVFVVQKDGTIQRRDVIVAYDTGKLAVISKGLSLGERIVRAGAGKLTTGQRVSVVE